MALILAIAACGGQGGARVTDGGATGGPRAAAAMDAALAGPAVALLESIDVDEPIWPAGAGAAPQTVAIARELEVSLGQAGMLVAPARPSPGVTPLRARLRVACGVELGTAAGRGHGQVARGAVALRLEWRDDSEALPLEERDACEVSLGTTELSEAAQRALACAVAAGTAGLAAKEMVRRGDPATVLAALASSDPTLRAVALAAVGERHVGAAVPRLLEMLGSSDVLVRDGAIGALVALREPRAVPALTHMARFDDIDTMRRVIDAVDTIGGDETRSFLELVASGHEMPEMRALASQALDRLNRREGRAGRDAGVVSPGSH